MSNIDNSDIITVELTESDVSRMASWALENERKGKIYGQVSIAQGTRKSQQDSSYLNVEEGGDMALAIICDGMGGLQGGEQASQEAVKTFVEDFEVIRQQENNYYHFFQSEVEKIDKKVAELTDDDGVFLDAGTTLVAVAIKNGWMQWISVGDSKIYIIRKNDMVCVAKEHNYLNMLNEQLLNGEITEEEYAAEQVRGAALTSYIGMGNVSMMEMNHVQFELMDEDIILLCSDGLYKAIPEERILEIVKEDPYHIDETLNKLQREAKAASIRSQDNTSIIMMLYKK